MLFIHQDALPVCRESFIYFIASQLVRLGVEPTISRSQVQYPTVVLPGQHYF